MGEDSQTLHRVITGTRIKGVSLSKKLWRYRNKQTDRGSEYCMNM